jgi:hypothetical protein
VSVSTDPAASVGKNQQCGNHQRKLETLLQLLVICALGNSSHEAIVASPSWNRLAPKNEWF